mgnify:CR=1 FL=1
MKTTKLNEILTKTLNELDGIERVSSRKDKWKLDYWMFNSKWWINKKNIIMKTTTADNILFSIVTIAGLYGCLYILLGTLTLVELFLGLR